MKTTTEEIWSQSIRGEILGLLKMILGVLAWGSGIFWLAAICFCCAIIDFLLSLRFSILEITKMVKKSHNKRNKNN